MRKILSALALSAVSVVAVAQSSYGIVVGVQPVYAQTVVPSQHCYQSGGVNIPGAIIGGAIGSRIGNGSGRDAAVIIGAITGSHYGTGQVYCQPSNQIHQSVMYDVVVNSNGFVQVIRVPIAPALGSYITVPVQIR